MENFMTEGSEVIPWPDGRAKRIIAFCDGKKVVVDVVGDMPKRFTSLDIPYFDLGGKLHPFFYQMRGIISTRKKIAEKFKHIKKADWAADLTECNVNISSDGKVIVPRWQVNEQTGERKRVLMPAKDINAAIRMLDHMGEHYDSELSIGLNRLLTQLNIIRPCLELRRQILIYARDQMRATLEGAHDRFKRIASLATRQGGPAFKRLEEKTAELIFLLANQWANPYRTEVEQIRLRLAEAKKMAAKQDTSGMLTHLLKAKVLLKSLAEEAQKAGQKLADIDPIKTLAEVDRRGLISEVLTLSKVRTGRDEYRLAEILAFAREVLEWGNLKRETPTIPPARPRPPVLSVAGRRRRRRQTVKPRFEQSSLDLH